MNAIHDSNAFTPAESAPALLLAMTTVDDGADRSSDLRRALGDRGVTVRDWTAPDLGAADDATALKADVLLVTARTLDARVSALIQTLGAQPSPFMIVLSDADDVVDRIVALELGADDVLPLDSHPREILARARGLMRRRAQQMGHSLISDRAAANTWVLNDVTRQLRSPMGAVCSLSKGDIDLINALADEPSDVYSLDRNSTDANTLRVAISRLRSRFRKVSSEELPIRNIWGAGYAFDASLQRISARQ